jgi:pimeloyl-ACP methyl ester carboxylesterase
MADGRGGAAKRKEEADLRARLRTLDWELDPITPAMAANVPTWRAAYSDRTCALMAAFCEIAYDRFEDMRTDNRQDLAIKLAGGGFTLINTYNSPIGTQAFLATSDQFAVLAFRGTAGLDDWGTNLNARREALDPARPQIKVHGGFLQAFKDVEALVRADVDKYVKPTLGLYITGHSLGGAVAQIAAALLRRDNLAACYTYGAPRVGGLSLDRQVRCPHYRMVNAWDLVPAVPPPLWNGYLQGGDVRTLWGNAQRPDRHNRFPILQVLAEIWALIVLPFSRRFLVIDDHMIWNYREKLEAIVALSGKAADLDDAGLAMSSAELAARFEIAAYTAARRARLEFDGALTTALSAMAAAAGERIVAAESLASARQKRAIEGEGAFDSLVWALLPVRNRLMYDDAKPTDSACLTGALADMGAFAPFW